MGGNNTECLAELDDYLHQEYLAKKGANSLFFHFWTKDRCSILQIHPGKSLDAEVFDRNLVRNITYLKLAFLINIVVQSSFRRYPREFFSFVKFF